MPPWDLGAEWIREMNSVAIIPARMDSSRYPGKPMVEIRGMPMIGHVLLRTELADSVDHAYVATCDDVILEYVRSVGGNAVRTADTHERATDRTAEAVRKIEEELEARFDIVVMVQGDEPMVTPEMVESLHAELAGDPALPMANLMVAVETQEERADPNAVKVVVDPKRNALYFSRAPIPSGEGWPVDFPTYRQLGIIGFRRDFLFRFSELQMTPLERIESVDMLRPLEHGLPVRMVLADRNTIGVDTPEDLGRVKRAMQQDQLVETYRRRGRPSTSG